MNSLSDLYSPEFGRKIDPMTEIMTSVGAYESLYAALTAFTDPGDEVDTVFFSAIQVSFVKLSTV